MDHRAELTGRRVLVVEDEFLLAMELETLLDRHGSIVLGPVSSVDRALAALEDEQPDLAFLDVNLRGERATPVAAALRRRGVPFVLITGYSSAQLGEPELRHAPRVDKPVNCRDLGRAVARALNGGKPGPGA